MKLKNKRTGEIGRLVLNINPNRESYTVLSTENGDTICGNLVIADYDSLAELNEEWEDYEEPKEYWYIEADGSIIQNAKPDFINHLLDRLKNIGNYFETEEEAEKAAEKLKTWKRLKDKGFKFYGYTALGYGEIHFMIDWEDIDEKQLKQDLDLLFGGENE